MSEGETMMVTMKMVPVVVERVDILVRWEEEEGKRDVV